jgi:hypothetical protein
VTPVASITVRVPLTIRRRPGRKTVVTPEGVGPALVSTRADPTLLKALARAHRWQRLLDDGRYASISELAVAEKIERGFLGKMLRLTLLAPDIVEGLMAGQREIDTLSLTRLPVLWARQRATLAIRSIMPEEVSRERKASIK